MIGSRLQFEGRNHSAELGLGVARANDGLPTSRGT